MSTMDEVQLGDNLTFSCLNPLGSGRFGKTFQGKFQQVADVAIKRWDKWHVQVDLNILSQAINKCHPNIKKFSDTVVTTSQHT